MHRHALMFTLAILGGSTAVAQAIQPSPALASAPGQVDKAGQTEDVKFQNDSYNRMTVPVRLSGTGPYRFLVDTGADRTAISRELAAKLKLEAGQKAALHSVTELSTIATANVPDLQFTQRNVRVKDAALLESANMGADGILGVDSLRSQRVMFDFEGQTMSIVPSMAYESDKDRDAIVITARSRAGRLIITQAKVNGRRVTVVLDTGSEISVGNASLRRLLVGTKVLDPSHRVEITSVTGGKIEGDYMFVRELEMSGVSLNNLGIIFAEAHSFKTLNLGDRPAILLGMNAMRAFKRVSIDFTNKTFKVVLPQSSENNVRMAAGRL
jgi:predicted aspartyl protease